LNLRLLIPGEPSLAKTCAHANPFTTDDFYVCDDCGSTFDAVEDPTPRNLPSPRIGEPKTPMIPTQSLREKMERENLG